MVYQIKIKGELDKSWSEWLGSLILSSGMEENGSAITTLTVNSTDQAALFGILDRIRDLNLTLISVTRDGEEI